MVTLPAGRKLLSCPAAKKGKREQGVDYLGTSHLPPIALPRYSANFRLFFFAALRFCLTGSSIYFLYRLSTVLCWQEKYRDEGIVSYPAAGICVSVHE